MTTLTLTHPSAAEAEAIAETLRERGFAAENVAVFGGGTDDEIGDDEAALTARLADWAIEPDAAAEKAALIAGGAAIVVVRVTDEDRELALAILEGRGDDPVNDTRADDEPEDPGLDGLATRLSSSA